MQKIKNLSIFLRKMFTLALSQCLIKIIYKINVYLFFKIMKYYFSSLKTGTWLSINSVNFKNIQNETWNKEK